KLVCQGGMYSGAQFALDKPIIMGLDGNICTIIFRNDSEDVGKVHCRVELLGGKAYLEDLGSLCATYANTKKLAPYEKVELSLGDCVKLGAKEIFILK
ncbi:MAG: FHA domain-containing protein, partial [Lachnospiraceae bacterium]|nr:FHA domain-containing protein [Lachnospiraceae bacterium]